MSNRLFQGIVHQMKDAIDRTIGVIDETSVVIACSELGKIGEVNESVNSETLSSTAPFVVNGYTYRSFGSNAKYDYAVFVQGTDEYAQKYAQLLSVSFASIKQYYDEKYDRSNFIKNVILDNILPGDIYLKARELHFNSEVSRVCLLIKIVSKTDVSAYDIIQNLFPDKTKDFVINLNETDIALIKEVKPNIDTKDLEKLARSIADGLGTEFYSHVLVGIGTTVEGIKDLARSFREAQVSLEVGKVFDTVVEDGKERPVLNVKETAIAQDRQELIKSKFADWLWQDIDRRERVCRIYNDTFNSIRPREYDGSHLRFVGMNPEITLRKHQVTAIAHVIYGGNTLLAHEVGAGKTYEIVAAAMEMKRLGLCTKSLVVVPNHITEQWAAEWLQLYPAANILVATERDFEKHKRRKQ